LTFFYAGQRNCSLCKVCDDNAETFGSCLEGGSRDLVNCSCNAGYVGNGVSCTLCANKTKTWLMDNCLDVNQSYIEYSIRKRGKAVDWCDVPNITACTYSFPSYRAVFSAGNATLSQSIASGQFLASVVTPALASQIMNAAFSKNVGSEGAACTITAEGSSCSGVVPLLAVPGLLISTTPGIMCYSKPLSFCIFHLSSLLIGILQTIDRCHIPFFVHSHHGHQIPIISTPSLDRDFIDSGIPGRD
jgi:hypothetical protein